MLQFADEEGTIGDKVFYVNTDINTRLILISNRSGWTGFDLMI